MIFELSQKIIVITKLISQTVVYAFFYKVYKNLFPVHSDYTGTILENCMCPINFTNTDDNIYQISAAFSQSARVRRRAILAFF